MIEYLANTDPWDANSRLEIEKATVPGTIMFSVNTEREDVIYEVLVSPDLLSWNKDASHLCAGSLVSWHLNGNEFVKVGVQRRIGFTIDSDQDGLDDYFEEALVASNSGDAITHIGEVHPNDDFDNNGTINLNEPANTGEPMPGGSYAAPDLIDPLVLKCVLDSIAPKAPAALVVHTPLR